MKNDSEDHIAELLTENRPTLSERTRESARPRRRSVFGRSALTALAATVAVASTGGIGYAVTQSGSSGNAARSASLQQYSLVQITIGDNDTIRLIPCDSSNMFGSLACPLINLNLRF